VSNDGQLVAITYPDRSQAPKDSRLRVWHPKEDRELLRAAGAEFLGFSPDDRHFATTESLWRLTSGPSDSARRVIAWNGGAS